MISTERLFYKIDQRLNKLSSNAHQEIPVEDKVLIARECVISLVKNKLDTNNIYQLGFEAFKKRYQDLQKLVEDYKDHPLSLSLKDPYLNEWKADITALKPAYMFYVDSYVIADKDDCKNIRVDVNNDIVKHGDIPTLLNNSNYRPSFEYRETFPTIASDEISIYTDGSFTPKQIYVSYLRYPVPLDMAGYEDFDGNPSTTVDCELEEYLEDELLDLITEKLAMFTENSSAVAYAEKRKSENE